VMDYGYSKELDTLTVITGTGVEGEQDVDEYRGFDLDTDEGVKHVYAVGAFCWTWWDEEWDNA